MANSPVLSSTDCLPGSILRERAIEPSEGASRLNQAPGCFDNVIDQFGHTVFAPEQIPVGEIDFFLRESAKNLEGPTGMAYAGYHYLAFGKGQLFAFPPNCEPSFSNNGLQYTCHREDTLRETYKFAKGNSERGWRLSQEVQRADGRLIRTMEKPLSFGSAIDVPLTTFTTWYVDEVPFITGADGYLFGFQNSINGDDLLKAQHIGIRYLNPYRDHKTYTHKVGSFFTLDSFTFDRPEQRAGFYRSLDQFVASHDVNFDPEQKKVTIDGITIPLITKEGSTSLTEAELWDHFFGLVYIAPFLPFIPVEDHRLFLGSYAELVDLAKQYHVDTCLPPMSGWGYFCPDEKTLFFNTHPDLYRSGEMMNHIYGERHEWGHALAFAHGNRVLSKTVFEQYVRRSLDEAGMLRGSEDRAFIMDFAISERDTARLAGAEKERFSRIWKQYDLDRYFIEINALSGREEFFAETVELWHPWHSFEADRVPLHDLFAALDSARIQGPEYFGDRVSDDFPPSENVLLEPVTWESKMIKLLGGKDR